MKKWMTVPKPIMDKLRLLLGNDEEQIGEWLLSHNDHLDGVPFFMIEHEEEDVVDAYLDWMLNK
jgi:metal-dependent hydrolase (beta-lactamase superfamily II)